ncbi:PREDICTED: hepatocyte growth factor receptor-like [Priapulus caudatus]|uniref:Hepatocyte growth factor receptor-like n=1 Tax=Priapulus caudatus TaxID=37621 RepID=A0ABM1F341_PRICU|nr:PREDICTED: hepatocyte growth factor receptor-like [Priapulus caudatus]
MLPAWTLVRCALLLAAASSAGMPSVAAGATVRCALQKPADEHELPQFTGEARMQRILVHDEHVYIGATNALYQLDSRLKLIAKAVTGPVNDSPDCRPFPEYCTGPRSLTDNENKVLLKEPDSDIIIVCGSVDQGLCSFYSSANVSAWSVRLSSANPLSYAGGRAVRLEEKTSFLFTVLRERSAVDD